ncbi:transposase [Streptomyces sp. UNOB3_S3]|nr:transposase [Streptomyces sp. UNOB3_S3]
MTDHTTAQKATGIFVAHRNLLFTVAYEMLGSAADAEDALQETWLCWVKADLGQVRDQRAHLVRIATRQAFNRLRAIKRRREAYVGQWLPEPLLTTLDMSDRDAARELLWRLRMTHPQLTQVFAGRAYAGQLVSWAGDLLDLRLRTVSRPKGAKGFVVVPHRWKVERTLGRLMKARRSVRDYERLPEHAEAHLTWSLITLMTRRLARGSRLRNDSWDKTPHPNG